MTEIEEWREIEDYPDYEISNLGQIRSSMRGKPKIMKQSISKEGYLFITLRRNKEQKGFLVHRLLALTFIENPNPDEFDIVDHINGIRHDNRLSNLQWVNNSINMLKAKKSLSTSKAVILRKDGVELTFISTAKAALFLKVYDTSIQSAAKGRMKTCKGYTVEYTDVKVEEEYILKDGEYFVDLEYREIIDVYEISNKGTIRRKDTKRILKYHLLYGYPMVRLIKKEINYGISIHRLVALNFIDGETEERCIVNHKDENRLNFSQSNLEWVSYSENSIHSRHNKCKKVIQYDLKTNETIKIHDNKIFLIK